MLEAAWIKLHNFIFAREPKRRTHNAALLHLVWKISRDYPIMTNVNQFKQSVVIEFHSVNGFCSFFMNDKDDYMGVFYSVKEHGKITENNMRVESYKEALNIFKRVHGYV